MQFNPGDNSGIVDEIHGLCDTTSTSHTIATITRRVNQALETVEGWIRQADGTWQFDDENYSTIPEGTTDLVASQSDYSFANTFLDVEWVKIKNSSGYWQLIPPVDQSELDHPLEDYLITAGFPTMYDKVGDTIRLYPAPSASVVTLTAGMKVGFKRGASQFATTDTTKAPGFASPYHIILAYMASIPYCASYKKDRVGWLNEQVGDTPVASGLKKQILDFYGNRERDRRKIMSSAPISFR